MTHSTEEARLTDDERDTLCDLLPYSTIPTADDVEAVAVYVESLIADRVAKAISGRDQQAEDPSFRPAAPSEGSES